MQSAAKRDETAGDAAAPPSERESWTRAAAGWTRHAARIAEMTRPATEALLAALDPRPGEVLLDVAAGVGDPSLRLLEAVGPAGRVAAVDGAADMLRGLLGRRPDARRPLLAAAAAEGLPFRAGVFAGVTCRFGAMFFEDPRAALDEVRRVLAPGGRAVFVVWGRKERNPYFTLVRRGLQAAGFAAPEPPPGTRTPFECEDAERLAAPARAAGFARVAIETVPFSMHLPDVSPAGLLDVQIEISNTIADLAAAAGPAVLERTRAWLASEVASHATPGGLRLPAECHVLRVE